ncbi:MAG: hypothetical protein H6Q90_2676 [Deltaproteobacteria bacterium]|nr:hypothetical protein [Deltaproteobacteria bacterium]
MLNRLMLSAAISLVACACPSKATQGLTPGSGSASGGGTPATSCDGLRGKVEQLYRADAQVSEPKRVEEAVADNTTMVLNDCAKAPDQVVACVNGVTTVAELESRCLRRLDEEGSEGKELRK